MSRRAAASYKPQTPACHAIRLQTCTFVFNNFQDAPPANSFISTFCIVAGGWYGSPLLIFNFRLSAAVPCLSSTYNRLRTLSRSGALATSLDSILCALFLVQSGVGGMYTPSSVKEQ